MADLVVELRNRWVDREMEGGRRCWRRLGSLACGLLLLEAGLSRKEPLWELVSGRKESSSWVGGERMNGRCCCVTLWSRR